MNKVKIHGRMLGVLVVALLFSFSIGFSAILESFNPGDQGDFNATFTTNTQNVTAFLTFNNNSIVTSGVINITGYYFNTTELVYKTSGNPMDIDEKLEIAGDISSWSDFASGYTPNNVSQGSWMRYIWTETAGAHNLTIYDVDADNTCFYSLVVNGVELPNNITQGNVSYTVDLKYGENNITGNLYVTGICDDSRATLDKLEFNNVSKKVDWLTNFTLEMSDNGYEILRINNFTYTNTTVNITHALSQYIKSCSTTTCNSTFNITSNGNGTVKIIPRVIYHDNLPPSSNNNLTFPSVVLFGNSTTLQINVTDTFDPLVMVNISVTYPNSTTRISNITGTANSRVLTIESILSKSIAPSGTVAPDYVQQLIDNLMLVQHAYGNDDAFNVIDIRGEEILLNDTFGIMSNTLCERNVYSIALNGTNYPLTDYWALCDNALENVSIVHFDNKGTNTSFFEITSYTGQDRRYIYANDTEIIVTRKTPHQIFRFDTSGNLIEKRNITFSWDTSGTGFYLFFNGTNLVDNMWASYQTSNAKQGYISWLDWGSNENLTAIKSGYNYTIIPLSGLVVVQPFLSADRINQPLDLNNHYLYAADLANQGIYKIYNQSTVFNSSLFDIDAYGWYNVTVHGYDRENINNIGSQSYTIYVNLGNVSLSQSSKVYSQTGGDNESFQIGISHDGNQMSDINITWHGNITNATLFNISVNNSRFNISDGVTEPVLFYINSSAESTPNGSYTSTITIQRLNDGSTSNISITTNIAGAVGDVAVSPTSKTTSMFETTTTSWDLQVNNNGNRILEDCHAVIAGTFSDFATVGDDTNFSISVNGTVTKTVSYTTPQQGDYSGNITISCIATAASGLDEAVVSPIDVSVLVTSGGGGQAGGGGGSGSTTSKSVCDLVVTKNIKLDPDDSIAKLEITNNEQFSFDPSFDIQGPSRNIRQDGSDLIEIKGDIGTVLGGQTKEVVVIVSDVNDLMSKTGTFYSTIRVGSSNCVDEIVDVKIIASTVVPPVISEFSDDLFNFLDVELTQVGKFDISVMHVGIFIFALFSFSSWLLLKSKSIVRHIFKVTSVSGVLTAIALLIIYFII